MKYTLCELMRYANPGEIIFELESRHPDDLEITEAQYGQLLQSARNLALVTETLRENLAQMTQMWGIADE